MGLFSRLGSIIRGFFGLFVDNLEKQNPDALFADIKNQVDKARKQAEEQIVEIQTNAELIKIEMKNAEKTLEAVKARIETAKNQGDKDILVELLMQEEEAQAAYESKKATYDTASQDVAKIREDFKVFESEMTQKLNEIKSLKSQAKMAQLKENINSINAKYAGAGNSVGKINDQLDRARDMVNQKTARANAIGSLSENNTELKLKKIDLDSARERAKARAEAMMSGSEGFEVKEKTENKTNA
ncbi:MAG: PspA/IM30 family protein [Ignavibacteriales bacterium]